MMGFALVFVLAVTALSATMAGLVRLSGRSLRRRGAHVERQAVELAAGLPVALSVALVVTLAVASYLGTDHCSVHDHHAHLCLAHGDTWAQQPWVAVVLAAAAATLLARLAVVLGRHGWAAGAVRRLHDISAAAEADVRLVDSTRAFCFVAGLWRPRIYVSTAAWHGLTYEERTAMLAHERGHVVHRDLLRRLSLDLVLAFAAPLVAGSLVARWGRATERLRDGDAVQVVGAPEPVASAMVHLCRLELAATGPGLRFAARGNDLADRVEALLADEPTGRRAARALALALLVTALSLTAMVAVRADFFHHALETLLG